MAFKNATPTVSRGQGRLSSIFVFLVGHSKCPIYLLWYFCLTEREDHTIMQKQNRTVRSHSQYAQRENARLSLHRS